MDMHQEMRHEILRYLEKNSRVNLQELAVLLGVDETLVANEIADMEKEKIICGYHTLIDWDKTGEEKVTALIEVRVTPQRNQGFDRIAERIYNYPEVFAVYLISGGYDLLVTLDGKSLKEVSRFVSEKLSPIDSVIQYGNVFHFKKIQRSRNDHGSEKRIGKDVDDAVMRDPLSKKIVQVQPSGIRKFFDVAAEMDDVISLGVGEPDFDTPWRISGKRESFLWNGADVLYVQCRTAGTAGRDLQILGEKDTCFL